jgi:putative membrane protein
MPKKKNPLNKKYDPLDWFSLFIHGYSSYVLTRLWPMMIVMAIYCLGITWVVDNYVNNYGYTLALHSLLGIVLGLILVFRINTAYDRWWEGRIKWGELVNNSRTLAKKIHAFVDDKEVHEYFKIMIPNFAFTLKEHLRDNHLESELESSDDYFFDSLAACEHKPNKITSSMYVKLNELLKTKKITTEQMFILDKELKAFVDILGACERIKNTPIPYSYTVFIKKFILTFAVTLPLAVVNEFYYLTTPVVLLLFYILSSIELISEEIEDPFGTDINDLPTDEIAEKIKLNVFEIFNMGEIDKMVQERKDKELKSVF